MQPSMFRVTLSGHHVTAAGSLCGSRGGHLPLTWISRLNAHAQMLAARRSLSTGKGDVVGAVVGCPPSPAQAMSAATAPAGTVKLAAAETPRRLVTSARVPADGYIRPALYDESTPIPRCESYSVSYHMDCFPWLLSAERQRVPMCDLETTGAAAGNSGSSAVKWLPLAARRRLAHALNLRIAERALGSHAMDSVCAGAAMALPSIARLLSSASSSGTPEDTAASLAHVFSAPLLARYTSDLDRLRNDNVRLALEVYCVNSTRIHQIRTQTGPAKAFAALASLQSSASSPLSCLNGLRAGLVRQGYRFSNVLGASYAAPVSGSSSSSGQSHLEPVSWASGVWAAAQGKANDVRVRVDVELNVDMRYRLIGRHSGPSEYDRHNGTTQIIVDDDATRNLILTIESAPTSGASHGNSAGVFEWRVADIDYLLSSEKRIKSEFEEARSF